MARILVTGGAGFIGSHLCEALLRAGHDLIALDNFDDFYDPAIKRRSIEEVAQAGPIAWLPGDIRDASLMERLLAREVDTVVHLAARAGVRPSIAQPLLYQDVNVRGTLVLLEACRKIGVKRFIFGSSSSVYGNNQKVPFAESDPVDQPISPYAASKRAGELLCHTYHHLYAMDTTCLRYFTVYGPRQRPDLSIHKFARLMEADRPIPVFGDGSMRRDFTYVDDIVDGTVRAIERCGGFHVYNLGGSHPVSVLELIAALEGALRKKAIIERLGPQPGDVERTFADIRLARQELAWEPKIELAEGLARFVRWFRGGTTAAVRARRAS